MAPVTHVGVGDAVIVVEVVELVLDVSEVVDEVVEVELVVDELVVDELVVDELVVEGDVVEGVVVEERVENVEEGVVPEVVGLVLLGVCD